jgi:hypothetical protein
MTVSGPVAHNRHASSKSERRCGGDERSFGVPQDDNHRPVWRSCALLSALALLVVAGCNSLPAGQLQLIATPTEAANPAPVILIRGWRDLWSDGIDRLAERLKSAGIETAVFKDAQAKEVGAALTARVAAGSLNGPVILIGFSYGADDVIEIATKLSAANRPVDLLVLIDPVTPSPIPTGVRRCVNYYQPNGVWDMFPWLRGVPVKPAPSGSSGMTAIVENIDIRSREDLAEPGTSHKTIAGNTKVHAAIVAEVRTVLRTTVPPVPLPESSLLSR